MRVAIIAPNYSGANRGNGVTVRRIERYLRAAGCDVAVFQPEKVAAGELLHRVAAYAPDCIHAFHAMHGGMPARELSARLGVPYVITITGTDLYGDGVDGTAAGLAGVLSAASGLAIFHESLKGRLLQTAAVNDAAIAVIPQGVAVPEPAPPEREGEFIFLLPAGIRQVKNVLFALKPLAGLLEEHPRLRFRLVGPVLDERYGEKVAAALADLPFVEYGGERQFEQMADEYASAHVVLNTSLSEGGMANSLLEGMAAGRPVLAAAIEGNRSLVADGVNGLLYGDETDFALKAGRLMTDPLLRQRLGLAARHFVRENCAPVDEAQKYLALYRRAVNLDSAVGSHLHSR